MFCLQTNIEINKKAVTLSELANNLKISVGIKSVYTFQPFKICNKFLYGCYLIYRQLT